MHVVSDCVILKMAVNIKDLYGNSGKRFKLKYSLKFLIKYSLPYLLYLFLLAVWLFSRSIAI